MRKLTELTNRFHRVWLYVEGEEFRQDFFRRAVNEGFKYINGSEISSKDYGILFSLHENLTIGHLSMFIWCLTFNLNQPDLPVRIDYKKYINGDEDYICRESPIKVKKINIH